MGHHGTGLPFIPEGEIKIIGKVIGTVSSKDLPDKDELGIMEEICHDKIMGFREKNRI